MIAVVLQQITQYKSPMQFNPQRCRVLKNVQMIIRNENASVKKD